jgi:hypothetical protein
MPSKEAASKAGDPAKDLSKTQNNIEPSAVLCWIPERLAGSPFEDDDLKRLVKPPPAL